MKMLSWSKQFNIFCFLDNNNYGLNPEFECILAAGESVSVRLTGNEPLLQLKKFHADNPGWIFGHFSFDLLHEQTLPLVSSGKFGKGFFFKPEIIIRLKETNVQISSDVHPAQKLFDEINAADHEFKEEDHIDLKLKEGLNRSSYINVINKLLDHIRRGDCYEINFCQYFTAKDADIDPHRLYNELVNLSPNPFSAFYRLENSYCICASPERYLRLENGYLSSQPIKGTSKRDPDKIIDEENKVYLQTNSKERSENVMIVDLVRNDLSRVCERGSVEVEELFGVYAFPQVYQMISTIRGRARQDLHWTDHIRATFPMGSMTGAPKKRVVELIRQHEKVERGLFSGSIGYVNDEGNFDFNVVIRSVFLDKASKELSFFAGSGITFHSNPETEYEECLVKAEAIMKILNV